MSLYDSLKILGLEKTEITIYRKILEFGSVSIGQLARHLKSPRTTLYGSMKRLIRIGLVRESLVNNVKTFYPEPLEKISALFDEQLQQIESSKQAFESLLPNLQQSQNDYQSPRYSFYEGVTGVQQVLKDMLLYRNLTSYAFWPIQEMIDILGPDFFHYLNKKRIQQKIYTKAIWPQGHTVELKDHPYLGVGGDFQREIRIAPPQIDFSMGYWMYGNKVAFVSSRKECFGFIIESREMVEMLLTQHNILWEMSTAINGDPQYTDPFLATIPKQRLHW